MKVRIAHLSDLHYHFRSTLKEVMSKRILGLANLYIKGRVHHFDPGVAAAAIQSVVSDAPDAVAITGDLTALATSREFELARQALDPILSQFPTFIIPGNHDVYTRGSVHSHRMETWFGPWLKGDTSELIYPTHHRIGPVTVWGMNPCRATVGSSGLIQEDELERLKALLVTPRSPQEFRMLMIHYPLLDFRGQVVNKWTRRLNNRDQLVRALAQNPVDLVIHGHDHLRYHNRLTADDGRTIYVANAGSAAFALREGVPISGTYNLYEIEDGILTRVIHKDYTADGFVVTWDGPPPPTGPYFRVGSTEGRGLKESYV